MTISRTSQENNTLQRDAELVANVVSCITLHLILFPHRNYFSFPQQITRPNRFCKRSINKLSLKKIAIFFHLNKRELALRQMYTCSIVGKKGLPQGFELSPTIFQRFASH